MGMDPAMAQILGNLVADLNPYANRNDPAKDRKTGDMNIFFGNPDLESPSPDNNATQVHIEVDGRYAGEWNFKGEPQKINKAVRLKYRVPVLDKDENILYWVDEYLLIGFEGANCA